MNNPEKKYNGAELDHLTKDDSWDDEVEEVELTPNQLAAARLLGAKAREAAPDLQGMYEQNKDPITILNYKVNGDSVRTLYASELLIGHRDSAVDFYDGLVDQLQELPEDMRPDIAVTSGFMQGAFENLLKDRRATLVPGLETMDAQFKYGRQALEKLQATGPLVVYNMGDDDMRIAQELTYQAFLKMEDYTKGKHQELGLSLAKSERLRRHPKWNDHYQFNVTEVFPYNLRNGRSLYSADKMAELTDGAIEVDEYFVLFDTRKAIEEGGKPPVAYAKWIKQQEAGQMEGVAIADDFNMIVTTKGKKHETWVRHYLSLTGVTKPNNHMRVPTDMVASLAANGHPVPNRLVTQNNQEEVGVGSPGSWVISTAGLMRSRDFANSGLRHTSAYGDNSRRLATTRRRIPEPGASIHEDTDDGRTIVTVFNDKLNEKSHSIPERMTIAEICDLQTGSITMRPDLLAKQLDIIRQRVGEQAVAIFFGGDMIHGNNYHNFFYESQQTGLMSVASQKDFNLQLFGASMGDMTKTELDAIPRVLVQPGNHEWNTGTQKVHGDPFTDYMRGFFERQYARAGYSDAEIAERVKSHEAMTTKRGEYLSSVAGVEYFGDMGVLIRHYLNGRNAKGGGGGLPIYEANSMMLTADALHSNTDVFMTGHWHHPQHAVFGDKLAVVGGSIAGLSEYEFERNYRATIAGTLLHIGGGLPPQIEFISEEALHKHKIQHGALSDTELRKEGYRNDRGFDAAKNGLLLPDSFPKSALQKRILQMMRDASQRKGSIAELR